MAIDVDEIDDGGHDHDGPLMIKAGHELNKIVNVLKKFQASHPETLIIVTADHETGGMTLEDKADGGAGVAPDDPEPYWDEDQPRNIQIDGKLPVGQRAVQGQGDAPQVHPRLDDRRSTPGSTCRSRPRPERRDAGGRARQHLRLRRDAQDPVRSVAPASTGYVPPGPRDDRARYLVARGSGGGDGGEVGEEAGVAGGTAVPAARRVRVPRRATARRGDGSGHRDPVVAVRLRRRRRAAGRRLCTTRRSGVGVRARRRARGASRDGVDPVALLGPQLAGAAARRALPSTASAAATARAGTSSIRSGSSAAVTTVPRSSPPRTRTRPAAPSMVRSAPIRSSTGRKPVRSGPEVEALDRQVAAGRWRRRAQIQNAACDGSPGTVMVPGSQRAGLQRDDLAAVRAGARSRRRRRARAASPRCGDGSGSCSRTTVIPSACRPASSTADLTWALATGGV